MSADLSRTPAEAVARRGYWILWSASGVSTIGDGLRYIAFPLLAASLSNDPRAVAIVFAAGNLPWPLFGLLAGATVDRVSRVALMWRTDIVRAIIVATFAVVIMRGDGSVTALAAVAFALGLGETLFENAASALLPQLIEPAKLNWANANLQIAQTVNAMLIGPPLGALLFSVGHAVPLTVDAISFAVAAALVWSIHGVGRPGVSDRSNLMRELAAGLQWLWRDRFLRTACLLLIVLNATLGAGEAILVLYCRVDLRQGSYGYTALLISVALGGIAGSIAAQRLRERLGLRHVVIASAAIQAAALILAGLTSDFPLALGAMALVGAASACWSVVTISYRQTVVPAAMLGRVTSAYRVIAMSALPLGAALGGVVAHNSGLHATYLSGGLILAAATVIAAISLTPGRNADQ